LEHDRDDLLERLANYVSRVRGWAHGRLLEGLEAKGVRRGGPGMPRKETAKVFGVSLATVKRWIKRRREGGDLAPRRSTGRRRRILSTDEERRALWVQLEGSPDATLERHRELWEERRGCGYRWRR
jgi:transposase